MTTRPLRLAVLISGSGSNLQAIIDAIESSTLTNVEIALVACNRADALGLQRALKHKIPAIYLPWKQRELGEERLSALLRVFEVDLIVLAGWMRIFTPAFIQQYPRRIINLHPALLPDNGVGDTYTTSQGYVIPVLRGLHVVEAALAAHLPVTGSTVHYVIPEVDAGPAICHAEIIIEPDDDAERLHERIKEAEHGLILQALQHFLAR